MSFPSSRSERFILKIIIDTNTILFFFETFSPADTNRIGMDQTLFRARRLHLLENWKLFYARQCSLQWLCGRQQDFYQITH